MSFYVRNRYTRCLIEHDGYGYFKKPRPGVMVFGTVEEAKAYLTKFREVVEITYGLRWYTRKGQKGVPRDYMTTPCAGYSDYRKDARRFATAAAARAAVPAECLSYSAGPNDVTGFRVVRFARVVK